MQIQTVFKAGNSEVVAIPPEIRKKSGIKAGSKVVVEATSDGATIIINRVENNDKKAVFSPDFFGWLEKFNGEYGQALAKLAKK